MDTKISTYMDMPTVRNIHVNMSPKPEIQLYFPLSCEKDFSLSTIGQSSHAGLWDSGLLQAGLRPKCDM